jgi:hypothetical protein
MQKTLVICSLNFKRETKELHNRTFNFPCSDKAKEIGGNETVGQEYFSTRKGKRST